MDKAIAWKGPAAVTAIALAGLVLWDRTGLDLALAALAGTSEGFALREHWLFSTVLHSGARWLAWLLAVSLCIAVWWPVGPLRRIAFERRLQLASTTLLATGVVSLLKAFSPTSCPWDLNAFGGIAHHARHWLPDGGPGHCFPAGHACAGFAFIGGWFCFRDAAPDVARAWLAASLAAGFALGGAQQLRGAHFMSHTLWSAWICWAVALAADGLFARMHRSGR